MRTTLNIQDDVFQTVSLYASARAIKLGDAVSELLRNALQPSPVRVNMVEKNGTWVFSVPENVNVPKLSAAQVKSLIDDAA